MIDLGTMLGNLKESFTSLRILVMAISYVAGIIMIFRAFAMLKAFGQHITQMSSRGEVAGPMVYLLVGAILLYMPSTLNVTIGSLFSGTDTANLHTSATNLLAYMDSSADAKWREVIDVMVGYMQLIGLVAFTRGWFVMSTMGNPGVQPGSFSKGLTHIIGGVMAMNIIQTMGFLANTLGFNA